MLLHGIGGELSVWDPVMPILTARRDVVAIDLPGFGDSPPLDGVPPSPGALAAAVAATLDALGLDTAHVAGNSLGAWVALELARTGRARSVVGICPAGLWGAPLIDGERSRRGWIRHVVRALGPLLRTALRLAVVRRAVMAPFTARPERVPYEAAWRLVRSYGRATGYAATNVAMRQTFFDHPEQISVPVTLAWGERDRLVRRVEVHGFDAVALPGCGHIPMWDDPALVARVLLQGTSVRPARAA